MKHTLTQAAVDRKGIHLSIRLVPRLIRVPGLECVAERNPDKGPLLTLTFQWYVRLGELPGLSVADLAAAFGLMSPVASARLLSTEAVARVPAAPNAPGVGAPQTEAPLGSAPLNSLKRGGTAKWRMYRCRPDEPDAICGSSRQAIVRLVPSPKLHLCSFPTASGVMELPLCCFVCARSGTGPNTFFDMKVRQAIPEVGHRKARTRHLRAKLPSEPLQSE